MQTHSFSPNLGKLKAVQVRLKPYISSTEIPTLNPCREVEAVGLVLSDEEEAQGDSTRAHSHVETAENDNQPESSSHRMVNGNSILLIAGNNGVLLSCSTVLVQ